jgi:hypothetical protein
MWSVIRRGIVGDISGVAVENGASEAEGVLLFV